MTVVTCAALAAPALGLEQWRHETATSKSACNASGCHSDGANINNATNAACLLSGCHASLTTSGGQKCWTCHRPGQAPTVACTGACHLSRVSGEDITYDVAFSHGTTPHLGASGYGKTCADCHSDGVHHDAVAAAEPTCAQCHNGTIAQSPPSSHNDGAHTTCTSCHDGMTVPAGGDCAACHVGNPSSGGPQITFSNDLTCGDAGCHGKIKNHQNTPISQAACTQCHTAHYEAQGTCTKCHTAPQRFHHATAKAIKLSSCAECHNGGIAAAPTGHSGFGNDCVSCHNGMNRPSSGDCASCHVGKPGANAPQVTYTGAKSCADAACHDKVKNHAGTPIASAPCTTCHEAHYALLGTCTTCHPQPESFHHAAAKAVPLEQCAECHDGTIATEPAGHSSYGSRCVDCHTGMDVPSGQCMTCHDKAQGKVPVVASTNDLSCGDAQCHAKVKNHVGAGIAAADCGTCHAKHYQDLGKCTTCHADPLKFHHGTSKATPLAKCETCHDGKIAASRQSHGGMACSTCHDDMKAPSVPAKCQTCHEAATFGADKCTACHSKSSGMFGDKEQVHLKDPSVACTTCHKPMYEDVGACGTCHENHAKLHHGDAKPAPSKLTATVSQKRVKKGARVRVGGTLAGSAGALAGQKVTLQARTSSKARYKTVSTLTTQSDGSFGRLLKIRRSTQYRLIWRAAGDAGLTQLPAVSYANVTVRR